ncbi:MAG: hypothetical protein HRT44_10755, partial [Bdellovibrionales bacterium]|nr:hypothetical protein [Bdellovibrionales bacterium]NQZ19721.1 hypothetical protein [Bdellovibrionales bacterium]
EAEALPRGGYSFSKVLDVASASQRHLIEQDSSQQLLMFGSFPSGLADGIGRRGSLRARSDIDVSLSDGDALRSLGFVKQVWNDPARRLTIRNNNAAHASTRVRDIQQLLQDPKDIEAMAFVRGLEDSMLNALQLNRETGDLLSIEAMPLSWILRDSLSTFLGDIPLHGSPMAVEISQQKIVLHLFGQRVPGQEAQVYSFEITE